MAEIRGIDVSRYNGAVDYNKVKNDPAGIKFVMIRCGSGYRGGAKDSRFEINYKTAKAAGLDVGTYFYSYAMSVEDAKKEAQLALEYIKGKSFEYPVVFDIEDKTQVKLGKAVISNIIRTFCEIIENAGYYVSVYANLNWLNNYIDDDCKSRYDIWVAQWSSKCTYAGAYGMWQYTSTGKCNGVTSSGLDMNIAYKNYPNIMKANGLNGYKKTSTSTPSKNESTSKPTKPTTPAVKKIVKGQKVTFKGTKYYTNATTGTPVKSRLTKKTKYLTGTYYIYDGIEIDGRYRVTNSPKNVGKKPIGLYVTGYVNKSDIK